VIDPSLEVGLQRRERAWVVICDQSQLGKLDCRGGRWISRKEELISEEGEELQQLAALVKEGGVDQ
jgi:hypothetical protein